MTQVFVMNSFAKTPEGGNPAGVVLNSHFKEEEMLKIASKAGFSETAFLNKIDDSHYEIKFFTPVAEVDLCGHATIASFALLEKQGKIGDGGYFLLTKAGEIEIKVSCGNVFMTQKLPEFCDVIEKEEILPCFGLKESELAKDLPIQVVSTGLRDILLPVRSLDVLFNLKPDFSEIAFLSKKYDTVGIHVFTEQTKYGGTAHCRNFAPLYDIDEEAATGTSNGALGCYLYRYNHITQSQAQSLVFEQGYSMKKPSEIRVCLDFEENKINRVCVGGRAVYSGVIKADI